jgi:predicted transcriptional regulator
MMAKTATLNPSCLEFINLVPIEVIAQELTCSESTVRSLLAEAKKEGGDRFRWVQGIHFVQNGKKTAVSFNAPMIKLWAIAKAQDDFAMFQTQIEAFQTAIGGGS